MPALRIRYQTVEFAETDIHLRTLRDKQQFLDAGGVAEKLGISSANWPMFGVVWPSAMVLAHFMADYRNGSTRILEVGCGIGLVSLLLNHRLADITATDHHPEAGTFLHANALLNDDRLIPFVRTGWDEPNSALGRFDLILGSDLLYEDEHVALLADFIGRHARPHCKVILVDPGRGRAGRFTRELSGQGFAHRQSKPANVAFLDQPFKGKILQYSR